MKIPLLINGPLIVTAEFCRIRDPVQIEGAQIEYDGEGDEPCWNDIRDALQTLTANATGTRASTDAAAAEQVHRLLPITRRQAANRRFWHYVTVRTVPQYVVWRWWHDTPAPGSVPRVRYLGHITRNALSRLWWLAQLTYERQATDPYGMTRQAASHSEFFQWCIDTLVCANAVAARSMIDAVFRSTPPLNDNEIKDLFKAVNGYLATHILDVHDADEISAMVRDQLGLVRGASIRVAIDSLAGQPV